jgi:two-component system, OmpR family, phosphate regulon sensor histidine kinase PhoR
MRKSLQKITLSFILISLIPVGFVIHELSSLSNNERIVTEAYQNQLDAILYSVNTYTDDVFGSWANKIDISLIRNQNSVHDLATRQKLVSEFSQMASVMQIYLSDLKGQEETFIIQDSGFIDIKYKDIVYRSEDRIQRLRTYQRGGFRKIEAIDTLISDRYIPLYFFLDEDISKFRLAIIVIDLGAFIQNVLAPKMQAVSQDKFIISAFQRRNNSLLYSTETVHPGQPFSERVVRQQGLEDVAKKELWLLPGYYLAISLKDATVAELVSDTVSTSVFIFGALFILLIAGMIFLYRNIRREMMLSEAKSEFVSNVSHEIRTPLSLISMYAETLEMNRVPEERKKEYYTIIGKETERLAGIVNRILNFATLDASRKKYEMKKVDLNALSAAIVESYRPHLMEKGFRFEYEGYPESTTISGDKESITEALINLLDNAIKYTRDDKRINVRTGREGDFLFVEVEDHGIGIAREYQKHIFEQFYRVPSQNVHTTKGTGLGLTLVKKTMNAHKGKITVDSTPDKGSTFRLYFPFFVDETMNVKK